MDQYSNSSWPNWSYSNGNSQYNAYQQNYDSYSSYSAHDSAPSYSAHHNQHLIHHQQMSRTTESKPRLSKDEVDVLEAEFQKNHKPNSSTKKALAESMRVDNARINNWFQNRRAREKKEHNIRQYEARQRLEKEQTDVESQSKLDMIESRGLVASSAPFPGSKIISRGSSQSVDSLVGSDTIDQGRSPALEASHLLGLRIEQLSGKSEMHETTTEILYTPSSENTSLSNSEVFGKTSETSSGYFYGQAQNYLRPDESNEPTPSISATRFPRHHVMSNGTTDSPYGSDQDQEYLSQSSPGVNSARSPSPEVDGKARSPGSLDIAARRNRRPPPLAIGSSRSYTGNGPRTALDHGNKGEFGRELRRVASAHGSVRIAKPVAAPRSPFHDRRTESLFHLNRSPVLSGQIAGRTTAPPTPDTPIVVNQPSGTGLQQLQQPKVQSFITHDPTLRTPPTTPGIGENFYSLNSSYDMSISDQPLVTPTVPCYNGDFEVPAMSLTAPAYVSRSATSVTSSQPGNSSYSRSMGPSYFGFAGGNAEYNWASSTATNRASSTDENAQFINNITTTNFN